MIIAVRYCAGCVLGLILVHLAVDYGAVTSMCRLVYVCLLFSPFLLFVILQHYRLQF